MGKDVLLKLSRSLQILGVFLLGAAGAHAADLPLATNSPLSGVTFEDRPLSLPIQRNFQMAMLTASSELGRSCGKMEAYGWRMSQSEQGRVNQIFNATVDHLRTMGYGVEAQAPTSVSRDITLFTADRMDHHFIYMWSAGELGLVMVLCESSQPYHYHNATASKPSVQVFTPPPQDVIQSTLDTPSREKMRHLPANFTPVGDWVGGYTCDQGYTGGTLQITHLNGENFDGVFRFYPTPKNPSVPKGSYTVYGQYDRASQRVLINPGKWLNRPRDYYNTIIVGSFDPVDRTFSGYFQGINGCTSFEAKAASETYAASPYTVRRIVKKKKKKSVRKKAPPAAVNLPVPVTPAEAASGIAPAPTAAPASAVTPVEPATPVPAITDKAGPSSIVLPAPVAAPAAPVPVQAPATAAPVSITPPALPLPEVAPPASVAPVPAPVPTETTTPKPSGSIEPSRAAQYIQLASSGQWITPTVQQAPTANYITPSVPVVPPAQQVEAIPVAPQANRFVPTVTPLPPAQEAQKTVSYDTSVTILPPATIAPAAQKVPDLVPITPIVPQLPAAEKVPDTGGPHP